MIVLRKRVGVDEGQMRLFEEYRYHFYITNDRKMTAEEVVSRLMIAATRKT